jgi:phosphonate transport system substrate-binding protein
VSQARALLLAGLLGALPLAGQEPAASPTPSQFRVAFSIGTIGEINRNDAKASTLAWGRTILSQRNIVAETVPSVFDRADDLFRVLQADQADAVAVLTDEYLTHAKTVTPDGVFLGVINGKVAEQYVLLVHQGSGIQDLTGLKGRSLEFHHHARTSLATAWLDTLLGGQKLGLTEEVFKKPTRNDRVSRTIHRVFFRQVDACVVTRGAFETAVELNPQVRKELRVLATSPELVPSLFFLRPGYASSLREKIEAAILTLHESPAGKQIMTVFQCDRLEKHPLSCLDSARTLLAEQAMLRSAATTNTAENALTGPTR